jgi:DNA polymerase III subunit delta'
MTDLLADKQTTFLGEGEHPRETVAFCGHQSAQATLLAAHNSDRLHHAWLITGTKGIGKATLAYRFARFLLSQPGKAGSEDPGLFADELPAIPPQHLDVDSDNSVVQRLAAGAHGNVMAIERQIDEKKGTLKNEIGVNQIRALHHFFSKTASEDGWRIAIIDSVDELNRNAANALLKLLEEPPAKSILLLVSNAPGRLLATIRSRCQKLPMKLLDDADVETILSTRFPDLGDDQLKALARLADGAPGQAISFAAGDGLMLYERLIGLMAALPRPGTAEVHKFAQDLGAAKADKKYRIFKDQILALLARLVRAGAEGVPYREVMAADAQIGAHINAGISTARLLDIWRGLDQGFRLADGLHMDRKQLILNMFEELKSAFAK